MNERLSLRVIASRMAEMTNIPAETCERYVKEVFDQTAQTIKSGQNAELTGLGTFSVNHTSGTVNYTPDQSLEQALNSPFDMFLPVELAPGVTEDTLDNEESQQTTPSNPEPQPITAAQPEPAPQPQPSTFPTSTDVVEPVSNTVSQESSYVTSTQVPESATPVQADDISTDIDIDTDVDADAVTDSDTDLFPHSGFKSGFVAGLITGLAIGAVAVFLYVVFFFGNGFSTSSGSAEVVDTPLFESAVE